MVVFNTLAVNADSSGILSSGQLAAATTSSERSAGVTYTAPTNGTLTLTLDYTGFTPGHVSLGIGMGGSTLTQSLYGNPIVIRANVAAHTIYSIGVSSTGAAGSYTLSYSLVDNNLPPTTTAFWSMPCFYTPWWDLPPQLPPYNDIMKACSSPATPDSNTTIPAVPTGLKTLASGNQVTLSWQDSPDPTIAGYRIYEGTSPDNLAIVAIRPNPAYPGSASIKPPMYGYFDSYIDSHLNTTTTYYYAVVAFTPNNVSIPSKINTRADDYLGTGSSNSALGNTPKVSTPSPTTLPTNPAGNYTSGPVPNGSMAFIDIAEPTNGAVLSGIAQVSGRADTVIGGSPVTSVQVQIDNNGFVSALGPPNAWYYHLNTRLYPNTNHTITVMATNAKGISKATYVTVSFKNGSYTEVAPTTQGKWISPEGMTITVNSTGKNPHTGQPWTIADIYYMVKACAIGSGDFSTIAPLYSVQMDDKLIWAGMYYNFTASSTQSNDKVWANFSATTYLNGTSGAMTTQPYNVSCYEYNHAWTEYYYHIVDYPLLNSISLNWEAPPNYMNARWANSDGSVKLAQEFYRCLNFIDSWDGCISDDRRILFGGPAANGGSANTALVSGEPQTNYQEPKVPFMIETLLPPQNQPGLGNWYTDHWMTGK